MSVATRRLIEDGLPGRVDFIGLPVMDLIGRHQADAEMMVVTVSRMTQSEFIEQAA